ncbi:hypothetical protein ACFQ48_08740 [Hymenobacter caeli]|uniref:Glycosyltransferase RgtA/B/C/D-like domain-containing protein n=1 Tax=Hymenobacter caeli TaxID=2735894 RepID=A0ABX2FRL5_9BACT|nr:hypothetical protein [Hymenobacter caeli]NRT19055.1 hypothetical protein [Hymenobacter caeli]
MPANNAVPPLPAPPDARWGLGLALLAVLGLRLWHLSAAGLPDYDSVRNWQLVQELAHGDGHSMFFTAGPGFNLLFALLACVTSDVRAFQVANAVLGAAGLGLFARFVGEAVAGSGRPWRNAEAVALVLLGGTGLLLTFSGRDFTAGAGGLVLAAGLLRSHFRRVQAGPLAGRQAALRQAAWWLAAGLCYSYKFLLVLPILGALEGWRADWPAWRGAVKWQVLGRLALPYAVLMAAGALLAGLPWYRWPATYVRLVLPDAPNPAGRQLVLSPDFFFYFRYLWAFESPLLLPGLAAGAWLGGRQWRALPPGPAGRPLPLLLYLAVWAGCWLAGMALLQKAPRGLTYAFLPLAALAVLSLSYLRGRWRGPGAAVLLAALALNGYRLWQHIYRYPPSHYPAVAAWLRTHGARRVASTVGLGLAPYLSEDKQFLSITNERQLGGLRRQGYDYVVLDAYWQVAHVARFDSLRRQRPLAAWPETRLTEPLLFLEHSEFTGLTYAQTLDWQREAAHDSVQLRVYRLGPR